MTEWLHENYHYVLLAISLPLFLFVKSFLKPRKYEQDALLMSAVLKDRKESHEVPHDIFLTYDDLLNVAERNKRIENIYKQNQNLRRQ